jgi:hypothetical protein
MKRNLVLATILCGLLILAGPAMAEVKDATAGVRSGQTTMSPLPQESFCAEDTPLPIPDAGPEVTSTIDVQFSGTIEDLNVLVQFTHTWVGDLKARLDHVESGCAVQLLYLINEETDGCCGCGGDDLDVTLDDESVNGVIENMVCDNLPANPEPDYQPGDPTPWGIWPTFMADCEGIDIKGSWILTVQDNNGADTGQVDNWCLVAEGDFTPNTGDGGGVPATSTWGVILLIALFLGVSLYYIRRRSTAGA